jgi:hypothetical protein
MLWAPKIAVASEYDKPQLPANVKSSGELAVAYQDFAWYMVVYIDAKQDSNC